MKYRRELELYEKFLNEKELAKGTQEIYFRQAREFLEYIGEKELKKELIIEYKNSLKEKELAASTYNLYITAVNNYLKFRGYEEYVVKTQKIQKRRNLNNLLKVEDYYRLLDHALKSGRRKYYYIMRTLALTGIRVSELRYITVESLEIKVFVAFNKGKVREVCLPDDLVTELKKYCEIANITKGTIFTGNNKKPITRNAVYQMMQILAEETRISPKTVHPHNFRHLFAVTYMQHYSNIFELADLLGHSNLEITRIYAVTTIEEKRKKLNRLGL